MKLARRRNSCRFRVTPERADKSRVQPANKTLTGSHKYSSSVEASPPPQAAGMADLWNTFCGNAKKVANRLVEEIRSGTPLNIDVEDDRLRLVLCALEFAGYPRGISTMAALVARRPRFPKRSLKFLELEGEMTESLQADAEFRLCPSPDFKMGPNVRFVL